MAGPLAALLPLLLEVAPHALRAGAAYAGTTAAATGTAVGGTAAVGSATAGTAAAAGSTGGLSGGLGSLIGRVMGGVEGFASKEGLGQGIQQAQELANSIAQIKQSISASHERQAEMVSGAKRKDEFTGATIDNSQNPDHLKALAEITAQRVSLEKESKAKNTQLVDLHSRISATTNPKSPMDSLGKIGGVAGGVSLASQVMGMFGGGGDRADPGLAAQLANAPRQMSFGPLAGLAGHLPGMKLAQNTLQTGLQPLTDLGVGKTEGQVMSSATNYATEGASKMLNPMAHARGEVLLHAAKLPGLLEEWGEGLVESKRHLVQFNGTLAQAFAEAERRGVIRNVESGQRTSGATAGLSDAMQDLADTVQPIKDAVTIVMSRGVEELVRGVTLGLQILIKIGENMPNARLIQKLVEDLGKPGEAPRNELTDFLREVNNNDYSRPRRVPKR